MPLGDNRRELAEGLLMICKSYPSARIICDKDGEYTITCTGQLYLDAIVRDLTELYSNIKVKPLRDGVMDGLGEGEGESQQVGYSIVSFCETVVESSSTRSFAETSDNRFRITMIAETLERGLAEDIENDVVNEDALQAKYNWNLLVARSILGFGPDEKGPNILLDDTLSSKVDKSLLNVVKNNIVEGFQFGVSIGPLCNDPIRNVKFKIVDVRVVPEPCQKYQILKTAQHAAHSAFLLAKPRIMEPVYYVEVQTPKRWVSDIHAMISGKRGKIKANVPLNKMICMVKAYLPVIEASSFEANILELTRGKAFVLLAFDHWTIVPGDPLDRSQVSKSRDFLLNRRHMKVVDMNQISMVSAMQDDAL